jgi:hypothetical protein
MPLMQTLRAPRNDKFTRQIRYVAGKYGTPGNRISQLVGIAP